MQHTSGWAFLANVWLISSIRIPSLKYSSHSDLITLRQVLSQVSFNRFVSISCAGHSLLQFLFPELATEVEDRWSPPNNDQHYMFSSVAKVWKKSIKASATIPHILQPRNTFSALLLLSSTSFCKKTPCAPNKCNKIMCYSISQKIQAFHSTRLYTMLFRLCRAS